MSALYYIKFLGIKAYQEQTKRKIDIARPLIIHFKDRVLDCNKQAFKDGIRPGDTVRQARLASPLCETIRVTDETTDFPANISNKFTSVTPFVEFDHEYCGVFADFLGDDQLFETLSLAKDVFCKAVITKCKSKLLAKSFSIWMFEQLITKEKALFVKKQFKYIEIGENYIFANIEIGKESAHSADIPISCLWPIPQNIISRLYSLGLKTFQDIQRITTNDLATQIGHWAYLVVDLVNGRDRFKVKPLYLKKCIEKTVNIEDFYSDLTPQIFIPVLREVSAELSRYNNQVRDIVLIIIGNFTPVIKRHKLIKSAYTPMFLYSIVSKLFEEGMHELRHKPSYHVSRIELAFKNIERISVKQMPLMPLLNSNSPSSNAAKLTDVLESVVSDIERKFGSSVLVWGIHDKRKHNQIFKPEILRREKMLSFWDPMKFGKSHS